MAYRQRKWIYIRGSQADDNAMLSFLLAFHTGGSWNHQQRCKTYHQKKNLFCTNDENMLLEPIKKWIIPNNSNNTLQQQHMWIQKD